MIEACQGFRLFVTVVISFCAGSNELVLLCVAGFGWKLGVLGFDEFLAVSCVERVLCDAGSLANFWSPLLMNCKCYL